MDEPSAGRPGQTTLGRAVRKAATKAPARHASRRAGALTQADLFDVLRLKPSTHSHPYNEIFIPLEGRFRFYWGENLEDSAELGPFDTISVPAGVFRTFENLDDTVGRILSLFDTPGDPHTGIVVPQAIFDQYYKGWVPGVAPKG